MDKTPDNGHMMSCNVRGMSDAHANALTPTLGQARGRLTIISGPPYEYAPDTAYTVPCEC